MRSSLSRIVFNFSHTFAVALSAEPSGITSSDGTTLRIASIAYSSAGPVVTSAHRPRPRCFTFMIVDHSA
jgi:hypothetical protein